LEDALGQRPRGTRLAFSEHIVKRRRALTVSAAAAATAAAAACVQSKPVTPTTSAALTPPITYAALGASDAAGVGVEDPQRDGWVQNLSRRLPQPTRLVNLGIPGVRLFEALEVELAPALEAKPHLITIWLVVNDILTGIPLDRYRADLGRLLGELRRGTGAKIAIGNVPSAPDSLPYLGLPPAERRVIAETWNAAIAAAAAAHGATLVDLNRRWPLREHPEYIGPDRLHPTAAGYRSLAETFHTVLTEERIV
jgi:lysophospholipase L1-like esterase